MQNRVRVLAQLQELIQLMSSLKAAGVDRARSDLLAIQFHLTRTPTDRPIVAVIGGTGTGKSSLVNRLLEAEVTATNFRRTFTAGPIAITASGLPAQYLSLPHRPPATKPPRGEADQVVVVPHDHPLLRAITLIDTPDIDGELIEHHALADRVFRWADAVIFLVTPEKYQMTELQPYYRLVQRYAVPTHFVMNKAEELSVIEDYRALLQRSGIDEAQVFAVARDDSTWQPPTDIVLNAAALRFAITSSAVGLQNRVKDITARLDDQFVQPLLAARHQIDRTKAAVETMLGEAVDVDVHPLSQQLQRRMRERSVLYLIGPQRIIDRVRTMPGTLVQLPRSMWDWARSGDFKMPQPTNARAGGTPDFKAVVIEQFQALQNRLEDLIRQSPAIASAKGDWKLDAAVAGAIVEEEVAGLRQWLETRWNATPRDTAILLKLLKLIPGGQQLTRYSEAAPYLLAVACVAKGAVLGHIDLIVLGGYSAMTWLTEKVNDEVAGKTRATNRAITDRYQALALQQIQRTVRWLDGLAPPRDALNKIASLMEEIRRD